MKNGILNGYIMLTLGVLVLASFEHAIAEQADVTTNHCLSQVQEAMIREEIKQLYAGDQKKINKSCEQGDYYTAIRLVEQIGSMKRCARGLNAHIKNKNLDITKNVRGRAMSQCRQGNLQKAIEEIGVAPTQVPATFAEITTFAANASNVQKGDTVILSWSTANANTVMLGRNGANDFQKVQASGSRSVSPDKTTTYILMVGASTGGPTAMKSKKLQIAVSAPPIGTCSVEGRLKGKWRQSIKERPQGPSSIWTVSVGVYSADSAKPFPLEGASVNDQGIYRFNDLTSGNEYLLKPAWTSSPEKGYFSCTAGKVHKGPTFTITGSPRID